MRKIALNHALLYFVEELEFSEAALSADLLPLLFKML
jgi:hypothetical protein